MVFFSTRELFSRPELSFRSNDTPALILGRAGSSSRRGPSHLTLLPQYLEWSPPVLQLSQSPCVYLIGLAELRCYHRAVVKLTPEFPGTGTSKFSPSCSRTTFIYKLDRRRFKATSYTTAIQSHWLFDGDSKPRHIPRRFKATDCSTAIQSHVIFLRRFKANMFTATQSHATFYSGRLTDLFRVFLPLSRLFSPSTTSVSSAKRLQPLPVRDPLFFSTALVQVLLA